ncbi:vacuolar import and degradation protein-domain-containing protein [Sporodiniella umbellata]|nr:vacuolar import and degradation protein-domain-containing protein [Sporodiniella umbellata]
MPIPSTTCIEPVKSIKKIKISPAEPLKKQSVQKEPRIDLSHKRLKPSRLGELYAGSQFRGQQECGSSSYEVTVDIKDVDIYQSTLCGYLNIKGLTPEHPELTTFFEAEIIGPKHPFHTRKWQADQKSDLAHWRQFPSFTPLLDIFRKEHFVYDQMDSDFIYMRWKETFLVPDHKVNTINGASFAGFYYICYQRSLKSIKGFYFYRHHKDWYQELTLNHVPDRGSCMFEFR